MYSYSLVQEAEGRVGSKSMLEALQVSSVTEGIFVISTDGQRPDEKTWQVQLAEVAAVVLVAATGVEEHEQRELLRLRVVCWLKQSLHWQFSWPEKAPSLQEQPCSCLETGRVQLQIFVPTFVVAFKTSLQQH